MKTSLDNIPKLAKKIANSLKGGEIFALIGPLGSGKTTFVKAICKQLKIKQHITSPTFILMNRYHFTRHGKKMHLYHLDIYRLKKFKEVLALGINEIWETKNNVIFIEWADKIVRHLPKRAKRIYFNGN